MSRSVERGFLVLAGLVLALLALVVPGDLLAQDASQLRNYGDFPVIGARGAIWITAQVHLMFAAFVLGVPVFAVVVEAVKVWAAGSTDTTASSPPAAPPPTARSNTTPASIHGPRRQVGRPMTAAPGRFDDRAISLFTFFAPRQ